jgi:large subunit ribosomal protein L10
LCADEAHQFGSNLETRSRPQGVDRGAGLSKRRPALGSLRVNLESGTAGSNPAAPAAHAGQPSKRKELAVDRAAKAESITELNGVFKTSNVVVVAHYSGLSVAQMQTLRKQMKQAGAQVKVAKNRLAKIALKDTDAAAIAPLLKGPTVIAYSGDPVAAPKVAIDFAKANEKFVVLGGTMGKTALDTNGVKALAALPSLDELRAKIVGLIQAPATKIAQLANAPAAKVARVVQAYASKESTSAAA